MAAYDMDLDLDFWTALRDGILTYLTERCVLLEGYQLQAQMALSGIMFLSIQLQPQVTQATIYGTACIGCMVLSPYTVAIRWNRPILPTTTNWSTVDRLQYYDPDLLEQLRIAVQECITDWQHYRDQTGPYTPWTLASSTSYHVRGTFCKRNLPNGRLYSSYHRTSGAMGR